MLRSTEVLRRQADEWEQLIATGRLVSLGEISASMAHEINNPLGIVLGFIQDMLSEVNPSDPNYRSLEIMNQEAERCRKIIKDLLDYARPGKAEFGLVDLQEVVEKTFRLVEAHLYKRKVQAINQVHSNLPKIHADPQQLEQVLVNLYLNAIDAMPEGGTLTVGGELGSVPADENRGAPREVIITVADTGVGIDVGDLPKIFHPFYTAKKKSGLGLGLPVCARIVKNHGGSIEVVSEPGQGATFKLSLPVSQPL